MLRGVPVHAGSERGRILVQSSPVLRQAELLVGPDPAVRRPAGPHRHMRVGKRRRRTEILSFRERQRTTAHDRGDAGLRAVLGTAACYTTCHNTPSGDFREAGRGLARSENRRSAGLGRSDIGFIDEIFDFYLKKIVFRYGRCEILPGRLGAAVDGSGEGGTEPLECGAGGHFEIHRFGVFAGRRRRGFDVRPFWYADTAVGRGGAS